MSQERFHSFEEFWPFYVREHSKKTTRTLHFIGTTAAMGAVFAGVVLGRRRWLKWAPVLGYGPAWFAHFFVEKNKPASFTYPLWSFRADMVMWSKMLAGTMDAEVARVTRPGRDEPVDDGGTGRVDIAGDGDLGAKPGRDTMN